MEIKYELVKNQGVYWCICIKYLEGKLEEIKNFKRKVDYMKILDEKTFKKFSKYREIRKEAALKEGVPVYMVFTDEELASMAKLDEFTKKNLLSIRGIGDKKIEKFIKYFQNEDEK